MASVGIPTIYRNTRFRSRLEARYAALFDLLQWDWVYEPLDAEGYIPDFLIQGNRPFFVEVGPCVTRPDYTAKSEKANNAVKDLRQDVLVVGVSPLPRFRRGWEPTPAAGILGEFWEHDTHDPDWCLTDCRGVTALAWGEGLWTTCISCKSTGVTHEEQSYVVRPCGHHPGGHIDNLVGDIRTEWEHAGNRVQWRGHAATRGDAWDTESRQNEARQVRERLSTT